MNTFYQAALVADSISLSCHWVYDQQKISGHFPEGIRKPEAPMAEYHAGKSAGDLTHYGDQTVILQASLTRCSGFDPEGWKADWLEGMKGFKGYLDGASRATIEAEGNVASASSDLGGAARIGPILDLDLSEDETVKAAVAQTKLTHGDAIVAQAAEFFVRAAFAVKAGAGIVEAVNIVAKDGDFPDLKPEEALKKARLAQGDDPKVAAKKLGQACGTADAFTLAFYFILRGEDFTTTLSENAMAGGDTSARAMPIALLYAAEDSAVADPFVELVNAL